MIWEMIDEQDRIMEIIYTTEHPACKVEQSHGISYVGAREFYKKDLGYVMGFDKTIGKIDVSY